MRTTTPGVGFRIVDQPVPVALTDDDAWAVRAVEALERAATQARWGHSDLAYSAAERLVALRGSRYAHELQLLAVAATNPREVLGTAVIRMPQVGNTHLAEIELIVRSDAVGTGVDDALLRAAEDRAVGSGRTVLILSSEHLGEPAANDPDAVEAPTGSGRIRRADPGVGVAERGGYTLEQAERYSVLDVPVDPSRLTTLREAAAAAAGSAYRTRTWVNRCPAEWTAEIARLETRMSMDAPTAGLELGEDPWDAERVRASELSIAQGDRDQLVTAVEHVPSHTLAGFTSLEHPRAAPAIVFQQDTLVLREHRGRRLGLLVKAVNLERLALERPAARRVHTWNAEENAHMLSINVALGFRGTGVYALWQKHPGLPPAAR